MQVLLRRKGCCGCHCFRENDIYSMSLVSLRVKKKTDGNGKVSQVETSRFGMDVEYQGLTQCYLIDYYNLINKVNDLLMYII